MSQTRRVLLADDQPHILLGLSFLVQRLKGVTVQTACTGPEALQLAIELKPDLILLDVMMPQMDGYAVCRSLRQHWRQVTPAYHCPIWFITARTQGQDASYALETGGDRVIQKPFDPASLLRELAQTLAMPLPADAGGSPGKSERVTTSVPGRLLSPRAPLPGGLT